MKSIRLLTVFLISSSFLMTSCSYRNGGQDYAANGYSSQPRNYAERLPQTIASKSKLIVVDPTVHAWGAYSDGQLVKAGPATAGGNWCPDINRSCRTPSGQYRIQSLGSADCKSSIYPKPNGGAPMPYCMFFNGGRALHGSYEVVEANVSHGCVRMEVSDAEWVRHNFAQIGTRVVVKPY
ncbi:MAG: hypothetical protein A3F14_01750 [Gammaproteobacteria bacterium RIFCSPHIGHO2_12_FULL_43_28]|nr:MAG: hypothetical protein A3F14_01750 [Gammaproteobacteria bacterium RIFCSPHIGHO2_12_FULL_43_28]